MAYRGGRGRGRGSGGRGRGAYYAAKYGGGGGRRSSHQYASDPSSTTIHESSLREAILNLSKQSYGAYKRLYGSWNLSTYPPIEITFDRIQSDAFAAPSKAHLRIPLCDTRFPQDLYSNRTRTIAFCDWLTRKFWTICHERALDRRQGGDGWSGLKGGDIGIDKPSQHVLPRTSCIVDGDMLEVRFTIGLPARGRTIEGSFAADVVTKHLPEVSKLALVMSEADVGKLRHHVTCVEDQNDLRDMLDDSGLVAFISNGAILPRKSGAEDDPLMGDNVVRFKSPPEMEVRLKLPSGRELRGMGLKRGISLIVGGGFHGKSTLLAGLEVGIYNHIPGDGREFVCVHDTTVSIRAEDGRSVTGVDISPFINNLPFGKQTSSFCTADASGSTSQAANIIEALDGGAKVLLTDEDLAATNFMMRDVRMGMLVPREKEPITPMIRRIRAMYEECGVSSILVVGGAGDYFEVADRVVMMDCYVPHDVTKRAISIAKQLPSGQKFSDGPTGIFKKRSRRRLSSKGILDIAASGKRVGAQVRNLALFGSETIDVSAVSQIVETSQTRFIATAVEHVAKRARDGDVVKAVEEVMRDVRVKGLDTVGRGAGDWAGVRGLEVLAALNRLRGVVVVE